MLARLLFQPECRGLPEAQTALGRLERYFNHREIDEASATAWDSAAEEFLNKRSLADRTSVRPLLVAMDRLLEQTRVSQFAVFSKFSPAGLESRLEAAGVALTEALTAKSSPALRSAFAALRQIESHFLASEHAARIQCVAMALRLVAWLQTAEHPQRRPACLT